MSPHSLALRTLLLGRTRSVLSILLIGASLCVLDLFAGHIASGRERVEYQAVIAERMGHLAIVRSTRPGAGPGVSMSNTSMFSMQEAQQVRGIVQAVPGVVLVSPQISVIGIASTGKRSALFTGEGVVSAPDTADSARTPLPGKLNPSLRNGIAVSTNQAELLGLQNGSNLTLSAVSQHSAPRQVTAQVVDVFPGADRPVQQHAMLMPLELAQSMLEAGRVERLVVYLRDPAGLDAQRASVATAVRAAGISVDVRTWQEQSAVYAKERSAADLAFDSVAGMVFAVIAATIAATLSINVLERRREVGTLRALGMRSHCVFLMFVMEALWMALLGIAASLVSSGLIAWVVNRVGMPGAGHSSPTGAPMLVELDFNRIFMAIVVVLAVALLASLVPAFKAARAAIAPALAA